MRTNFIILFLLMPILSFSQIDYNAYFTNKSLRFDFLLGGNSEKAVVFPQQIKQEPYWAGSKNNTIDYFNYGSYRFRVFDLESEKLIFSKGFSTLFQEWQTTAEAKKQDKAFYQAAIFPYPKKEVKLEIEARQWDGNFKTIYKTTIDPKDYFIIKEPGADFKVEEIIKNGKPENKVDVVLLAEGYTQHEMDKFIADAKKMIECLFSIAPYSEQKDKFNFYGVQAPSAESGTDVPGEKIYKNTYFNSTYYTFDVPRYLTTSDMKSIYDAAGLAPYDQVYLLVNSERYGGGGFYNFVNVCTSGHELSGKVFAHEFGHGFAGLGDEYYTSSVAYEDFYNLEIEPWEPNITTLVDFDKKWKNLLDENTPVPTPRVSKYNKTVGVFEGGGYLSKGIYSPMMDCLMKSNNTKEFCPACQQAILKTIEFYTK